ncbi:MAG: GlsB/YeaQ/YmgE family stress response membrane protein [Actinomycetota bacterium]
MILIAILGIGMLSGWLAGFITGMNDRIDWGTRLIAGLVGSFVGGMIFSLLFGDGLSIHPTGIVGSIVGAVVVLAVWQGLSPKKG